MHPSRILSCGLAAVLVAACGANGGQPSGTGTGGGQTPATRYDMANGCFALKAVSTGARVADPFFFKPTALGKYMLYATDGSYLTASNDTDPYPSASPSEWNDWTIDADGAGAFTIFSQAFGTYLGVGDQNRLTTRGSADAQSKFLFEPATGCAEFPEAQVNATGPVYKGSGVDKPVIGFADVHQHISATHFLGGAHYGLPFHKFGITEALKDCSGVHGSDGRFDIAGNFLGGSPLGTHDTIGWPTFVSWPERHSLMHESMYYKWIERTWRAGLRLLVNNLVENETLCNLVRNEPGHDPFQNCNEMENAVGQVQFMRDLQDYIDAQEGGPGKGWFRIVTTPAEARQVINDGKLAVVLGIEISHLFNCDVTQVLGVAEIDGCTESDIDSQIDRLYNLGVREMFPIHEFDNALGGNGIFDGFVLNAGNFADTGKFWGTYDCPSSDTTGAFTDYLYSPGAIMMTSDPTGATNPLAAALLSGNVLPFYPNTRQCNARWMTDLGEYAFHKMMEKKMIIEVDHLELKIKDQLMDLADQQTPKYPVVSTHGGHGGISLDQAHRILTLGGIISPGGNTNGADYVTLLHRVEAIKDPTKLFGMGFGADTNGLATQAGPRGSEATPVEYPFTLFQGPGWSSKFTGIAPVTFDREVTGERTFDINAEGWAHYGLAADFVEEVRLEGGPEALDALYNSAEVYLQMWERTVNR